MKKILITGTDSVAGANLAAVLAEQFAVTAVSPVRPTIAGCQNLACELDETLAAQHLISTVGPDVVVHCGPLAENSWSGNQVPASEKLVVGNVCSASRELDCRVILVSSDQVYRGPWMFHTESSDCLATSAQANLIRECEELVLELPRATVLRTHVVGWSPTKAGFVESALDKLEAGDHFDFGHFATPIGASRFAMIVAEAIEHDLSGTYNLGGAERCCPFGMAVALSSEFDQPHPVALTGAAPTETTLRSTAIRGKLQVALPTLRETVEELFEEHDDRLAAFAGQSTKLANAA